MKTLFIIFNLMLICFSSCKNNADNTKIDNDIPYIYPRKEMVCLLDSFLKEVDVKNNLNEIYVNKRNPWDYNIVIYSGKESINRDTRPLNRIKYKNTIFDLYSGLEHYFDVSPDTLAIDDYFKELLPDGTYWAINNNSGNIEILKNLPVIPFYMGQDAGVTLTSDSSFLGHE